MAPEATKESRKTGAPSDSNDAKGGRRDAGRLHELIGNAGRG
jgi:hypothetical protein